MTRATGEPTGSPPGSPRREVPSAPLTILLLAGGLGTRYGGPKQLDRLGPSGETLMDYALFDAWRVGFNRAVFVIHPDIADRFEREFAPRYRSRLIINAVPQLLEDLPGTHRPPPGRRKPWGTAQAVLAARRDLTGNFMVLNADDCYGHEAIARAAGFLTGRDPASRRHAVVGFRLDRTLSPAGAVNRAVLERREDGTLSRVTELTGLRPGPDGDVALTGDGRRISGDTLVSMNLWAMTPMVLPSLQRAFERFLDRAPDEAECYLPEAMQELIASGAGEVEILPTESRWCGVTHADDHRWVAEALAEATRRGEYPERMWG